MQPTRKKASKYTGVFRAGNKWKAQLQHRNACIYLGIYDTEEKAAEVYNIEKAKVLAAEDAGTQPDIFYNNKKRGGGGASPRNSGGSRRSKGERVTRASSAPIFEADATIGMETIANYGPTYTWNQQQQQQQQQQLYHLQQQQQQHDTSAYTTTATSASSLAPPASHLDAPIHGAATPKPKRVHLQVDGRKCGDLLDLIDLGSALASGGGNYSSDEIDALAATMSISNS
jgi:hypothetical protein